MDPKIRTRFLIISDTHGMPFSPEDRPRQHADVAIHCGDLTDGSQLQEFRTAIQLLKDIDAPLKLVIAGNHDFTMDLSAFRAKVAEASPPLNSELVAKVYGSPGQARQLFEDAKEVGIVFLDEGTHNFTLTNGALLTVYASPYTPALGAWGFQYHPNKGHDFHISADVNVAITHGPPKGILDYTHGRERSGCPDLFAAIACARPQIHCFGHIHEGWGARLVTWRDDHHHSSGDPPTHFTAIDNDRSRVIETLAGLLPCSIDTAEDTARKQARLERYRRDRCCVTSHCTGDEYPLEKGGQTLFVNASICGSDGVAVQRPWLVDIELPRASGMDC